VGLKRYVTAVWNGTAGVDVANLHYIFAARVEAFLDACPYKIKIRSGYRTIAQQVVIKKAKGDGAARPGYSAHQAGLAVDFTLPPSQYWTPAAQWCYHNAAKYQLNFSLLPPGIAKQTGNHARALDNFEAWHCEPTEFKLTVLEKGRLVNHTFGTIVIPTGQPPRPRNAESLSESTAATDTSTAAIEKSVSVGYTSTPAGSPGKGKVTGIDPGPLARITILGQHWNVAAKYADRIGGFIADLVAYKAMRVPLSSSGGFYDRWKIILGVPQVGHPSNHARGTAVDISAQYAPQGSRATTAFDSHITDALCAKWGMEWGIYFDVPDPHHFEVNVGVEPTGTLSSVGNVTADMLAEAIAWEESGNRNIPTRAKGSTASGYFQITDGTWHHFGGYPRAISAPRPVQKARAVQLLTGYLRDYKGNVDLALAAYYVGGGTAAHLQELINANANPTAGSGTANKGMRKFIEDVHAQIKRLGGKVEAPMDLITDPPEVEPGNGLIKVTSKRPVELGSYGVDVSVLQSFFGLPVTGLADEELIRYLEWYLQHGGKMPGELSVDLDGFGSFARFGLHWPQ